MLVCVGGMSTVRAIGCGGRSSERHAHPNPYLPPPAGTMTGQIHTALLDRMCVSLCPHVCIYVSACVCPPAVWGVQEAQLPGAGDLRGMSPRSSRHASAAALRRWGGPTCFAIPGNHDWIDGLEVGRAGTGFVFCRLPGRTVGALD